jgi:hypothetical protein
MSSKQPNYYCLSFENGPQLDARGDLENMIAMAA